MGSCGFPASARVCSASSNRKTEEWTVYPLPDALNQIPYALNIGPKGNVWICGTNSDSLHRFDPKTEELVEFRLPTRVTYTREIEFDADGNLWTCNSNGPARHTERGYGSIIKLEIVGSETGGGQKIAGRQHQAGNERQTPRSPNAQLLDRIDGNDLPKGYTPGTHQAYVDQRIAKLSDQQRARIGRLWSEKQKTNPEMRNRGGSFVRILEYVAEK